MTISRPALRLAVVLSGTFGCVVPSHSEEVLKLLPGFAKSVVLEGATAGNFTSIIGDPKIADVTFGPKNTFWFIGKVEGKTNIIVLDNKTGRQMYNATLEVSYPRKLEDKDIGNMNIHNKAELASYTVYQCDPTCEYLREVTAGEQAAAPSAQAQPSGTPQPTLPAAIAPAAR